MHDVTDTAFRQLLAEVAKPDVMFTEFVAVDGLVHPTSREKIIKYYLGYNKIERSLVAQLWGSDPKHFYESAQIIEKLGFDGIDINMGCPDKKVVKSGGGAALMQNAKLAREIIIATQKATKLPVSVKTRLGFNVVDFDFIRAIASAKPAALTIHARTKKELSMVPAHWDIVKEIVPELHKQGIIVLGNGDISSHEDALEKIKISGVDGVMIGRGVFGNPWIFTPLEKSCPKTTEVVPVAGCSLTGLKKEVREISFAEKLQVLYRHMELFEKSFEGIKSFSMLKKHVRGYIHGFEGAREMRAQIMDTKTIGEMKSVLKKMTNDQ